MITCGERIKAEAEARGLSASDVAYLAGYESDKPIYPVYRGDRNMSKKKLLALCYAWGLRLEYLTGRDNFRTDFDVYAAIGSVPVNEFYSNGDLLRSLGFSSPRPYCMTRRKNLSLCRELIPYMTADGVEIYERESTAAGRAMDRIEIPLSSVPATPRSSKNVYDFDILLNVDCDGETYHATKAEAESILKNIIDIKNALVKNMIANKV